MKRIDFSCFTGAWPFHRLPYTSFSALRAAHTENGIASGYVSCLDSVFYNDPFEAECGLAAALHGSGYRQVLTLNPMLDAWRATLRHACRELDICAVRIVPCLHGYSLCDSRVTELTAALSDCGLPLFVTLSMEDERAAYLLIPRVIGADELAEFLGACDIPVLLSGIWQSTAETLSKRILASDKVFFDTANLKPDNFAIERLYENGLWQRLVYGSGAPVMCMKSTSLMLDTARIPEEVRDRIFEGNGFIK